MDNRDLFRQFHIDASLFYDAIVNSTDDYIYLVDMQSDISLISENMYLDFDLPGRLVKGLVPIWGDLIVDKDRKRYDESIARMLNGDTDEHNVEYQIRNRKGELIWIVCRGLLKRDQDGAPLLFAGMITRLENKGRIDHITGLLTQKSCIDHLAILLESGKHGSMMLLGLDDFSHINTLQNHVFGDIVYVSLLRIFKVYCPMMRRFIVMMVINLLLFMMKPMKRKPMSFIKNYTLTATIRIKAMPVPIIAPFQQESL